MITIRLDVADLASVRFAYSPLQEAAFSLKAWRPGDPRADYLPLLAPDGVRPVGVDWGLLDALVGPRGWIPDFITPYPVGSTPEIAAELDAVRRTPPAQVTADLVAAQQDRSGRLAPLPGPLTDATVDPAGLRNRIVDALAGYWDLIMAPLWPQLRAVLDADIAYRCHRIAVGGAAALFADLDERVRWDAGLLHVDYDPIDGDVEVAGRGLPLMPSVFPRHATTMIDQGLPPVLSYPARGTATLLMAPAAERSQLAALLGATRARLLRDLAEPASTTQLAARYRLTPGAVSQHLGVLHAAGLLSRARGGRSVNYRRTRLGDDLLGGLSPARPGPE